MTNLIIKKEQIIKDNKGHKIVAAIYLVTKYMSENDPLARSLREHAVLLVGATSTARDAHARQLIRLLEAAVLAGLVSEKNNSIISYEVERHARIDDIGDQFSPLFQEEPMLIQKDIKKTYQPHIMSFKPQIKDNISSKIIFNERKSNRNEKIVSFMKEKKSATIKDISVLFPDTSEKTIQRELGALVQSGALTKRGNKRWSVYFYESQS